ncbi:MULTISPECIES: hypothetical protein [Enterobacteriaceae]|uniref:Uncharacterized protein n=1 Tax=Enterobacter asburiae TaxID=61645 RepID=A0A7W3GTN3_ENTAS|nr:MULTISPECIES: hypothetical protein [Enterobacteriaceae]KMK18925.1 hypothetical protein ABW10_24460 [Pluralibacter gergoviae]MBA7986513.1 hypothetical protein [Enterobacter asburiae]MBA8076604.1 hypothetical protein [Enterobacter asburiae]MBL3695790.1 hypothetical protein [Pluralibacter gergoviae]
MEFTVSLSTIITACLGFLGVYVLMPFALIFRDFLLIKFIEKFILNEKFWLDVRVRETDRAHMNHYYAKSMAVEFSANGGESVCKLDNEVVTHQELQQYESGRDFHLNRMNAIWSKIQFKNNIAMKMFKYFKLDEYEGYIAKRAQAYYDNAINMIKLKEGDGKTSSPVTTDDKK